MYKIRVAHFSTSESGGAAIAAQRLNKLLVNGGIESQLFTRNNLGLFNPTKIQRYGRLLLGKIVTKIQEVLSVKTYGILTPVSISTVNMKNLLNSDYDIIHIHNWYNLFSESDLAKIASRFPLVLTLHDERILTGGCHVTLGCRNFTNNCKNCPGIQIPGISLALFTHSLENASRGDFGVTLICPSYWIASQASISKQTAWVKNVSVIPNAIDVPTDFKDSIFSRKSSKTVNLLFVAANIKAHVKGLSFLLSTLSKYSSEFKESTGITLNLTVVGGPRESNLIQEDLQVKYLGSHSPQGISSLMKDFDFLVVPSYSENLPNVISEAQLVGLPVIASNMAGIPELVQESISGFLFSLDEKSLMDAITRAVESENLNEVASRAREGALIRSDEIRIFEEHVKVYSQSLGLL